MEYTLCMRLFGSKLNSLVSKSIVNKNTLKDIKKEYKAILLRAKDIGSKNTLLSSYLLAAYFIAMNRCNRLSAMENYKLLEEAIRSSRMVILMLGNKKSYFSKRRMQKRRDWAIASKKSEYENDWVLNFVEGNDDFIFGIDYLECGVCKLCRDEGVSELSKYLCKLDYMLADIIGLNLERTTTLAMGDSKCDFRYKN